MAVRYQRILTRVAPRYAIESFPSTCDCAECSAHHLPCGCQWCREGRMVTTARISSAPTVTAEYVDRPRESTTEAFPKICSCESRPDDRPSFRYPRQTEQMLRSRAQLEQLLDDMEPALTTRNELLNCIKCVAKTTYHGQVLSYNPYAYYRFDQCRPKEILPLNHTPKNKRFQCLYCDKSFGKSSHLRDHVRTHTGERPFRCSFCGKAFTQYSNLRTHVRIHTGEKPFKCKHCEKSFTQAVTLRSHLRTHTAEGTTTERSKER